VTAAIELTPAERSAIEERLVEQFGAGLEFTFKVDPAILGGLVIRVGDKLLDNSVASRMAALRQSLGVASR
jgi:F0F1-type ATP synthase delta subunit